MGTGDPRRIRDEKQGQAPLQEGPYHPLKSIGEICIDFNGFVSTLMDDKDNDNYKHIHIGWNYPPPRMPVTTRIITFLVGNPYKPSFVTVTGWGVDPTYRKDNDNHDDYC